MRVVGWKTRRRNESKGRLGLLWWELASLLSYGEGVSAPSTDHDPR
jgi:hypothetical protein